MPGSAEPLAQPKVTAMRAPYSLFTIDCYALLCQLWLGEKSMKVYEGFKSVIWVPLNISSPSWPWTTFELVMAGWIKVDMHLLIHLFMHLFMHLFKFLVRVMSPWYCDCSCVSHFVRLQDWTMSVLCPRGHPPLATANTISRGMRPSLTACDQNSIL